MDCEDRPSWRQTFLVRRCPTVLVANRYGQVESRLVGTRAIGNAIGVADLDLAQVRRPA